jgi:hypothetical protein
MAATTSRVFVDRRFATFVWRYIVQTLKENRLCRIYGNAQYSAIVRGVIVSIVIRASPELPAQLVTVSVLSANKKYNSNIKN